MKRLNWKLLFMCGLLLTLAAFPVLAQENKDIQINQMPLNDFARSVKEKVNRKELDLTKSFSIQLIGDLTKDEKIDPKTARFIRVEGDAAMIETGKHFIEAVNDSGMFVYLKHTGIDKINFTLAQNDDQIYAVVSSELETSNKAMKIASAFNLLISLIRVKGGEMKNVSEDDKFLINGLKTSVAEKQ